MKLKKYTEQQLKEMPLTEIAYVYISGLKRPVSFNKLTDIVFTMAGVAEGKAEKMGQFYTDLTVDGRFVTFSNGKWDLRYRHRFEAFEWEDVIEPDVEVEDLEVVNTENTFTADIDEDNYSDDDDEKLDVSKIITKPNDEFDDELE